MFVFELGLFVLVTGPELDTTFPRRVKSTRCSRSTHEYVHFSIKWIALSLSYFSVCFDTEVTHRNHVARLTHRPTRTMNKLIYRDEWLKFRKLIRTVDTKRYRYLNGSRVKHPRRLNILDPCFLVCFFFFFCPSLPPTTIVILVGVKDNVDDNQKYIYRSMEYLEKNIQKLVSGFVLSYLHRKPIAPTIFLVMLIARRRCPISPYYMNGKDTLKVKFGSCVDCCKVVIFYDRLEQTIGKQLPGNGQRMVHRCSNTEEKMYPFIFPTNKRIFSVYSLEQTTNCVTPVEFHQHRFLYFILTEERNLAVRWKPASFSSVTSGSRR